MGATVLVVVVVVAAVVAAAPQIALRVVEYNFAIAINGALKMLLELGSAITEDARWQFFYHLNPETAHMIFLNRQRVLAVFGNMVNRYYKLHS